MSIKRSRADQEQRLQLWCDSGGATWRHVLDTLEMFRVLQRSFYEAAPDRRGGIDLRIIAFGGYDGNGESDELGVARSLIELHGMYPESRANVAGAGLDSHCPMKPGYRRMLDLWRPLGRVDLLSVEMVATIAAARHEPAVSAA